MEFIEIRFLHFKQIIRRADIKTPTWFAVKHDILNHPDFKKITGDEFKAFIWISGVAAHLNKECIRVDIESCAHQARIKESVVISSIDKLAGKRWEILEPSAIRTDAYGSVRGSIGDIKATSPTVQNSTEEYSTEQDTTVQEKYKASAKLEPHVLERLWNENRGELKQVTRVSKNRRKNTERVFKELTEEEWVIAIKKVAASDYCNGKNKFDFVADYNWFIKKDANNNYSFDKALDCTYDNRANSKKEQTFKNHHLADWATQSSEPEAEV